MTEQDLHPRRSGSTPVDVSVVVPVRSGGSAFTACLEALRQLDPPPVEIIVVVDGTDADSDREDLERAVQRADLVLALEQRCGPAVARNHGVRVASASTVLFVDADVALAGDVVGRLSDFLHQHQGVDAVFGAYDSEPADPAFTSQYKNLVNHLMHSGSGGPATTFWSGCGAVRRSAFAAVGGFDERYRRPEMEDIELGARLVAAGHQIRLEPGLAARHLKRWTPVTLVRTDLMQRALPWSALILRTGQLPNELDVSPRHRLQVALVPLAAAALAVSPWWRPAALGGLAAVLVVLVLDLPLLRGLRRLRGRRFALCSAPWRLAAYAISGVGLAVAVVVVAAERLGLRPAPVPQLRADLAPGPLPARPRSDERPVAVARR